MDQTVKTDYRDKILQMALQQPLVPSQVGKALSTNTILASAMLSEMAEKGMLKVSKLKYGSSPLYYVPGKEEQLLGYVESLNEKDRGTLELLKQKKVLRDNTAEPLIRVSLRQIRDFSTPLEVSMDGRTELFWKWFLTTDEEAEQLIRKMIEEPKVQQQKTLTQEAPAKQPALEPLKKTRARQPKVIDAVLADPFLKKVKAFFEKSSIKITEQVVVKKRSEYDFIIELTTSVGSMPFYCKARSKKKIGEPDLTSAFVQAQLKKLSAIFITDGQLTKQAQALALQLKGLTVKQI